MYTRNQFYLVMNHPYLRLMRFDKPVGILLLLWPCLWAIAVATELQPSISLLSIFILGAVIMRSAGCVINDIADRHFDGHVKRTQQRPLVTGEVSVIQATALLVALLFVALMLVYQLNIEAIQLAFVGALLTIFYPFMKRWVRGPQLFLGLAFSWSIPMVYAAANVPFDASFYHLFALGLLWPVIYDTFYALTDLEDDLTIGIHSTAIWFGQYALTVLTILQLVFLALIMTLPLSIPLSNAYYYALWPVVVLMFYQLHLIYKKDRVLAFQAFRVSQWQGGLLLAAICLGLIRF